MLTEGRITSHVTAQAMHFSLFKESLNLSFISKPAGLVITYKLQTQASTTADPADQQQYPIGRVLQGLTKVFRVAGRVGPPAIMPMTQTLSLHALQHPWHGGNCITVIRLELRRGAGAM